METWNCLTFLLLALPSVFSWPYPETGTLLYPYGPTTSDSTTERLDDGGTDLIPLWRSFVFMNEVYRGLYVNNNGAISFKTPMTDYTPDAFPIPNVTMICPFWADCDNEISGDIYYRQDVSRELLDQISSDVNKAFPNVKYNATWAFVATWDKVAYHGSLSNKTNTFQCVLASDKWQTSMIIFNYENIEWTTGTASGGDAMTGRGGDAAQAGFNTDNVYFNIPLSRTDHIVNIKSTSNVDCPGRWMVRVDEGLEIPGGCVHKDSFMNYGQTIWDSDTCDNKCFCKIDGKLSCEEKGCEEGTVCLPSGRNFMCQIDEENC